jgi:hypothetical protein
VISSSLGPRYGTGRNGEGGSAGRNGSIGLLGSKTYSRP